MNVYDFDKTIFYPDSSYAFFRFCLKRYPTAILRTAPQIVGYSLLYTFGMIRTKPLKEKLFSFLRFLPDFVQAKHVGLGALGRSAKAAKTAGDFAHVGVVHDAKRRVAHLVAGINSVAYHVGGLRHFGPWGVFQQIQGLGGGEAATFDGILQQGAH